MIKSRRGLSLVEVVITSLLISVAFLGFVQGLAYFNKTVTGVRLRNQAAKFAEAEIGNFIKLSRLPAPDGMQTPYGYWNYLRADNQEHLEFYPKRLMETAGAPLAPTSENIRVQIYT